MALQFPSLDAAIGKAEGFGVAGAIPTVNNNPGDIIGGAFATSQGATGTDSHGFAIFPDAATGYAALDANLSAYQAANPNITLSGVAAQWAPASGTGNNAATPSTWLSNVTAGLGGGQNGNTPLSSLAASTSNLASATATAATAPLSALAGQLSSVAGFFSSPLRFVAIALGLIAIAGAIFIYKPSLAVAAAKRGLSV